MAVTPTPEARRVQSFAEAERAAIAAMPPDEEEVDDGTEYVAQEGLVEGEAPAAVEQPEVPERSASTAHVQQPTTQQPAAPVEQPAAAQPDPWAETEDVEYDDPDSGQKYVVRAPKTYADKVKSGYHARSLVDRKLGSLGRNRAWIEPLMANGTLDRMAPYLQEIVGNPEVQNVVAEIFNRRAAGRPVRFADEAVRELQQQQAPAPVTTATPLFDENALRTELREAGYDDYTIDANVRAQKRAASAYQAQLDEIRGQVNAQNQTWQQQQSVAQQQAQQAQHVQQTAARARQLLAAYYPEEINDQTPAATYDAIENYARSSGMLATPQDFNPQTFVAAYARLREINNPARTAAPSAAAATIADVDANARRLADQAAAATGRATASNGAAVATAPPKKKVAVPTHRVDRRTGKEHPLTPTEIVAWMEKHPNG